MVCRTTNNQAMRPEATDKKIASLKATRGPAGEDEVSDESVHPDTPYPVATKYPRRWR